MANELIAVRRLIADDAHALTFQTFGQYRTALLKAIDALAAPGAAIAAREQETDPELFLDEGLADVQDESGINTYYSKAAVLDHIAAALASRTPSPAASGRDAEAPQQAESEPVFPMTGQESAHELGAWQDGSIKPALDGMYLREFDEGEGTSEFADGKWLRDGFFPSDLQDVRWRGRIAPQAVKTDAAPAVDAGERQSARTRPVCRDCADFGPICPNDGKPCDGSTPPASGEAA